jgi:D-alanyl-lipoteichoic acid acyltransferase DltB (MBOAT superfamily)
VFLVSGFWHGANWTFIVWGGIHAALYIPVFLFGKNRTYLHEGSHDNTRYIIPSLMELAQIGFTFAMVSLAWVFFRADTIGDAWGYLNGIVVNPFLPVNFGWFGYDLRILIVLYLILEWIGRFHFNWLARLEGKWYRFPAYFITGCLLIFWGIFSEPVEFIYFQF